MSSPETPDFLRVEARGGIVHVWHGRSAQNVEEGREVLRAIDRELRRTGIQMLLFDSRDSDRTPPEVQKLIWNWLSNHTGIRRVATVMESKDLAGNVRVTGVERGVRLKTFNDQAKAEAWLLEI